MRKLICKCTIGEVGTETDWVEDLDVYLEDNEGDPSRVGSEAIKEYAERELLDIVNSFNEGEQRRMEKYGKSAKKRELKHFKIDQNRNYE